MLILSEHLGSGGLHLVVALEDCAAVSGNASATVRHGINIRPAR